jgi:glycosyltransferase involved in cell wall biosynthesis
MKPLISVIIPVYNGGAFLAEAVSSIVRQNYDPLEIIIIDDGSTDDTAAIAKNFREATYVYQENKGAAAARNHGLRIAQGELVCFLDADDLWTDNKITLQLSYFEKLPSTEVVIAYTQRMQLREIKNKQHIFQNYSEPVLVMGFVASMMRRSIFDKVGFIDETFRHCEDWDWFMKAKELGISMIVHRDVVTFYRRHDSNTSNQTTLGNHYTMMLLKRSLDRRRKKINETAYTLLKLSDYERN